MSRKNLIVNSDEYLFENSRGESKKVSQASLDNLSKEGKK
jgi:hypothetical protein